MAKVPVDGEEPDVCIIELGGTVRYMTPLKETVRD